MQIFSIFCSDWFCAYGFCDYNVHYFCSSVQYCLSPGYLYAGFKDSSFKIPSSTIRGYLFSQILSVNKIPVSPKAVFNQRLFDSYINYITKQYAFYNYNYLLPYEYADIKKPLHSEFYFFEEAFTCNHCIYRVREMSAQVIQPIHLREINQNLH